MSPTDVAAGLHAAPRASKPLDVQACEQFLLHEARLLDECRFDEWLALFTPDASYWVPSEPDQKSPLDTVSLIYDDRRLLETRVRRLASPRIYSQEPRSRTSRVVTNGRSKTRLIRSPHSFARNLCLLNSAAMSSGCSAARAFTGSKPSTATSKSRGKGSIWSIATAPWMAL
jgi:hypothetical protein